MNDIELWIVEGKHLLHKKLYTQSSITFELCLKREPMNFEAILGHIFARVYSENFQNFLQECDLLLYLQPRNYICYLLKAAVYDSICDLDLAIFTIQQGIEKCNKIRELQSCLELF